MPTHTYIHYTHTLKNIISVSNLLYIKCRVQKLHGFPKLQFSFFSKDKNQWLYLLKELNKPILENNFYTTAIFLMKY